MQTRWLILILAFGIAPVSGNASDLKPFRSDGCSLFPDASIVGNADWCSCCFQHDVAYWRGGTRRERKSADLKLRACVLQETGDKEFATLMYRGVRVGGSPYFYNWYRWGYGWNFERKYRKLDRSEVVNADELLADYFASEQNAVCPR